MMHFGGSNSKKSGGTPTTSPSKKGQTTATPPSKSGFFLRKALGTPVSKVPTTPSTPPITTPDSTSSPPAAAAAVKKNKERPTVDTIDIPLQSLIPSTPNMKDPRGESTTTTPSLLDSPNPMYRIDSALSDLSGSQLLPGATGATDPPALILRTSSIEAGSGSSGYINTNSISGTKAVTTSTAESIVTKVLGIVDISCVSSGLVPSTPPRTTLSTRGTATTVNSTTQLNTNEVAAPIRPTYSFQPEWGVAPEDEDVTLPDPNKSYIVNEPNHNNGSSTVKRELAEIAARCAAASSVPTPSSCDQNEEQYNNRQYRRYHETFELVYTEPTGKKNKKLHNAEIPDAPVMESNNIYPTNASSNSSTSILRISKGLRINQWVISQRNKAKKQSQTKKKNTPEKARTVPISHMTPVPLGIMSQEELISKNDHSKTHELLPSDSAMQFIHNPSVMAAATTTSTTTTTPPTDASSITSSSTMIENIEATKGIGCNNDDINSAVLLTATTGASSMNVTTLRDESKVGKGGNKSWYRFKNNSGKNKKEKKIVGFDNVIGEPTAINRTSPIKRQGFKKKGVRSKETTNDFELQSNPTKIVLKSIKCSTKGLETVAEEDYIDENTELKVRVPGFHNEDLYLSDQDLIGGEIVEEIYTTLNKSIEEEERERNRDEEALCQENAVSADKEDNHEILKQNEVVPIVSNESMLLTLAAVKTTSDGYQEYRDVDTTPVVTAGSADIIQQAKPKSWKERLGLKKVEVESRVETVVANVGTNSEVVKASTEEATNSTGKNKSKPQWKAAIDPVSGKTYYYHKKTRETTWTKPADSEIAPSKHPVSAISTKNNEDGDEIDRAMQSNASPNVPAVESASVLNVVDIPSEEKSENVDRMMSDITTTDEAHVNDDYEENEGDINEDDEFPSNLHNVTDSNPFDELGGETECPDDERKDEKSMTTARTRTTTSIYSGFSSRFSTKSRISEATQPIKNLSSSKPNLNASHASICTTHDDEPISRQLLQRNRRPTRIPKNIPVPRLRELNVEEFTIRDRDIKARTPRLPKVPHPIGQYDGVLPMYSLANSEGNGHGETDDADADKSTVSYAATDSISALSEADLSFVDRKEAYDDARRRALDRAIAQEDWDLAAKLSESMRKTGKAANHGNRPFPTEWVQSEMDRFISENDWDAVASYIAHVRANANEASLKQTLNHLAAHQSPRASPGVASNQMLNNRAAAGYTRNLQSNSSDVSGTSNPQKIFGARSQLQHRDLHSVDSHSSYSTTFDSEYTSESYEQRSEEVQPPAPINRPRQQEFAC